MSKRSRYSGKDDIQRKGKKSLPLDIFFEESPHSLLKGYSSDQLRDLLDKIKDLETAVDRVLDYDNEVQEILGAKLDGKVTWFFVKWEGGENSFIPANVLNRIAPEKVIQYYESVLQFLPNPNPKEDPEKGNEENEEDSGPHKMSRTESSADRRNSKGSSGSSGSIGSSGNNRSNRKSIDPDHSNLHFVQPKVSRTTQFKKINCVGCQILLQYPEGTKVIKCPSCNTIMPVG